MVVYGASYNYSDTTTTTTLVLATTVTSDTTSNTCTNTTTSLQQIPAYNCMSMSNSTSTINTDTFISCIQLYYYKYCVAATFNAIVYEYSNHDNVATTINQKNLVIMKNNMSAVPMSKILSNTSTNQTNEKTAMMMSTQNITILNLMHHRTCEHLQILLQQPIRDVMCTKMPPTVVCLLITEIAITLLMRLLKESPSQAC
jgi:hypothetical protein